MAKVPLKKVRGKYYATLDGKAEVRAFCKEQALYKISKALGRVVKWNEVRETHFFSSDPEKNRLSRMYFDHLIAGTAIKCK